MDRLGTRIPRRTSRPGHIGDVLRNALLVTLIACIAFFGSARAWALDLEDETLADRPVSSIKVVIRGKKLATEQEIRNNLRIAAGQPFDSKVVKNSRSSTALTSPATM
jgi:hypothetical protein